MKQLQHPPKSVISAEEATELLLPYIPLLTAAADAAWEEWLAQPATVRARSASRTRANFIYDAFVEAVIERLSGRRGVQLLTSRGLFQIAVRGKRNRHVLLRFKKLNANLRGSNVSTRQQQLLAIQADLPGLPPATKVVMGYTLEPTGTSVTGLWLTCPFGRENYWTVPVVKGLVTRRGNIIPLPVAAAPTPPPPTIRSTRRKRAGGSGEPQAS